VREFSVPALVDVPTTGNLTDLIHHNAAAEPQRVALSRRMPNGWEDVTTTQFLAEVIAAAKGLIAAGIQTGDRVALMSSTRYEWTLLEFAIWCAGAVTVPIYPTSSAEQVQWILSDSRTAACIVETAEHQAVVTEVGAKAQQLTQVWRITEGAINTLRETGAAVPDAEVTARRAALTPHSLATIIYTSGTTGQPKGCELTHGNFLIKLSNAVRLLDELFAPPNASSLIFVPMAHVIARFIQIGCIMSRARIGHTDITRLTEDLAAFQPTFVVSVPRVFEKVYHAASQKAHAEGKGKIFDAATGTAIAYSESLDTGGPGLALTLKHAVFDKLIYARLRAVFGGEIRYAISGGAPLGVELGHFFRGIGLTILEGYGLTETTGGSTVNSPGAMKIGTVGTPLPGVSVKIANDGEILLKGGNVFRGYWHAQKATDAAFSRGWFCTGDIGELDAEGYLTITGRKKELIVTAAGKNVAPAVIEDRIRAHPLVSQCMVVGDRKPYVACLVTIDAETFPDWKIRHGKPDEARVADLVADPDLIATVQEAVDEGNKAVSKAEAVKKFRILATDFTEADGQLTPTLKPKRHMILREFASEIEALYAT